MGLLQQYYGEQDDKLHPERIQWPGKHGLPAVGPINRLLKKDEFQQLGKKRIFRSKEFDLTDPKDHTLYDQVMERICNGWFKRVHQEYYRDPNTRKLYVYLEWLQEYAQGTPGNSQ